MTRDERILEIEHRWEIILRWHEESFEVCCNLQNDPSTTKAQRREAVREFWGSVTTALRVYVRTQNQLNHHLTPHPDFLLMRLSNVTEELYGGNVPTLVSDAAAPGRTRWRAERHDIAYAVFYLEAVKRRDIIDKSPNKTVREAYNVTANAVRAWAKDRDQICADVPIRGFSPAELREKMLECGERYTRFGRGAPSA